MILGELGLLHTDVGNYRIALGYLLDRDTLPYMDNAEGLDVKVSEAEALLHVGRDADAASVAESAIAMIERNPALAPYRLLALDRAAVNNLGAGHFGRALALYDQEIALVDASREVLEQRNRLVVRLSRAAAAVGAKQPARALVDLDENDKRLADRRSRRRFAGRTQTSSTSFAPIDSLPRGCGPTQTELDVWTRRPAIDERRAILDERFGETSRIEVEQKQMLVEAQPAERLPAP